MRATARFWSLAALPAVLTGWAVVLQRPLPLVGAAGVAAWLLAQQYAFSRLPARTVGDLTLTHRLSTNAVATGGDTYLTLAAELDNPLDDHITVESTPPPAADAPIQCLHLGPDKSEATSTVEVTWPVAGTYTFDAPTITVHDRLGLFEQSVHRGPRPTITVEATQARGIHVGRGGEPISTGFGEHETSRTGSGLEPRSVREYVPGDSIRQIDWKATARLGETHVREFTGQTELETSLFVDHRPAMRDGPPGGTKLDYARELALGIVGNSRMNADPLRCYTVSEHGLTGLFEPRASADHYERVRRHLYGIEALPDEMPDGPTARETPTNRTNETPAQTQTPDPHRARQLAARLGDDSTMGRALAPFLDQPNTVVRTVTDRPLFSAVELMTTRRPDTQWTILVTDDTERTELREAAKLASQHGGPVLVFLTPTVLYEVSGLDDLDDAYGRYAEFERFRTELSALDGVTAFEVGPADRLATVLDRGRAQRRTLSD